MAKGFGEGEAGPRRRRRLRRQRQRAADLFRLWHELGGMLGDAERLGDGELVHLLAVTRLLVEERARASAPSLAGFEEQPAALPH